MDSNQCVVMMSLSNELISKQQAVNSYIAAFVDERTKLITTNLKFEKENAELKASLHEVTILYQHCIKEMVDQDDWINKYKARIAELEAQIKALTCRHEWVDLHTPIQSEYEPDTLHVNRKCKLCGDVIRAQIPKAPEAKS